ncbi:MAG: substrate-binding domain-containing protein [Spirochaetaceae bacterium]|jgi:phosphate transport system substrate-binding protein|nr:substrate-binding domain-containing protein [Spirochaetaceae bacterium]
MQNYAKLSKNLSGVFRAASAVFIMLTAGGGVFAGGAPDGGKGKKAPITVISREEGSGTRTAFVEIVGVLDSAKNDAITQTAEVTNNTAVMMASVAGDKNAIGYISLGSLNNTVKALKVDGAAATTADVKSGAYKIARPFNIVTGDTVSPAAQHFINFILSAEAQDVVAKNGYLPVDTAQKAALPASPGTKIVVAGSSSVTPLMEKLREAYIAKYPGVNVEIQQSDSSTGINSVISGVCDIGMASRTLSRSEIEKGVSNIVIATDGIAIIVNRENPLDGLSREQIKDIYLGGITDWLELK